MAEPRRAAWAAALALALAAGAARASEESKTPEAFVDLSTTPVPVVQGGRLVNYVFVSARLQLTPGSDGAKVRAQEPFLRDLLVREASRRPFSVPGEPNQVDEGRIRTLLRAEAVRRLGPGVLKEVQIVSAAPRNHLPVAHAAPGHVIVP